MEIEYLKRKLANIKKTKKQFEDKQKAIKKQIFQCDLLIAEYEHKINNYTPGTKYNGKKYRQNVRLSVMEKVFNDVCRKYGSGVAGLI